MIAHRLQGIVDRPRIGKRRLGSIRIVETVAVVVPAGHVTRGQCDGCVRRATGLTIP